MTAPIAAQSTMLAAMSTAANAMKTAVFTLFVPLIVAVWVPRRMLAAGHLAATGMGVTRIFGSLLFVAGVLGYFWCAALFVRAQGTPAPIFPTQRAVVTGPYRINRNPMYTSVLAVIFGQGLYYQYWVVAAYGTAIALGFHIFVVLYEERALRSQFDGEYEDFCRRVPRWIPHLITFSRR